MRGLLTILLFLGFCPYIQAQDYAFSQYHLTPTLTNPGLFGLHDDIRIMLNYRYQTLETGDNFTTPILSLSYPFLKKGTREVRSALGVSFIHDNQIDFFKTNGGIVSWAYNLQFKQQTLSLGIQGGFFQQSLDFANFVTESQINNGSIDPNALADEPLAGRNVSYFVISPGILWSKRDLENNQTAFFGLSLNNLNRPDVSFDPGLDNNLPANFTLIGGFQAFKRRAFSISPNLRWIRRLNFNYVNLGSWFTYRPQQSEGWLKESTLQLGAWYNTNNALIFSLEWNQPKYIVAFSYDLPTASNTTTWLGNGALEFTVGLKLHRKSKKYPRFTPIDQPIQDEVPIQFAPDEEPLTFSPRIEPIPLLERKPNDVILTSPNPYIPPPDLPRTIIDTIIHHEGMKVDTIFIIDDTHVDFRRFHVEFALGKIYLDPSSENTLNYIAELLLHYSQTSIEISGYTCNIGTPQNNLILSRKRAQQVKEYLTSRGVNPANVVIIGRGEANPIAPNTTEAGRRLNRRVEVKPLFSILND